MLNVRCQFKKITYLNNIAYNYYPLRLNLLFALSPTADIYSNNLLFPFV